ncbi:hypothetical protein [Photobacterium damselae]|uniref:hypothetical protein n=1 Tax=Photobacterium damselae TaxID=38293 RepID=UPI001F3D5E22|nr:hypothetical protein [Photobacterium damselae]UKA04777.1 hypothetical protein IHC89_21280 [Photobacterium damselae subsp. damselae]
MIINLTKKSASKSQMKAGVINSNYQSVLSMLLTTEATPPLSEIVKRCNDIVLLALNSGANRAMIDKETHFAPTLENVLKSAGIETIYAF